ncbi:MAG: hypothetical protein C4B59_15675 [Candidatus Methanogaster sp.]|uniref:Uncharacterized protein n=1 Tax=Candidatus Methanogaster sp. TaxID=3386292 RepID=A0AC61KYP9_9EURY|nr:MAG: hypothetical protein C4B59_15675 [ANME-2 cluster archaeon]
MHPHIQTLLEIIKHTVDQEIVSVILFGGVATGHFKKGSDIDVLIIVKEYNEPVCKEYWKQTNKERRISDARNPHRLNLRRRKCT